MLPDMTFSRPYLFFILYLDRSHPEKTFPDENTPIPVSIYGQKPFKKGFLARAPYQNPGVSIRKFEFPDGN